MALNHASLASPDRRTAVDWLLDMALGMTDLTRHGVVETVLRTVKPLQEIRCADGWSLWDAVLELRRRGARDEYVWFLGLATKVPLLCDVPGEVGSRFSECESMTLPSPDGDPLLLAAITDGIAVGFPSRPEWDRDRVTVTFDELLPDGSIEEGRETIDNLTRSGHAAPIRERHLGSIRSRLLREIRSGADLWQARREAFPNLLFGPDVEDQLARLNSGALRTAMNRLADLDETAAAWREDGGAPRWPSKVTDESDSVKNSRPLRAARRFASSVSGSRELFMWHARFGSAGRIHLRFDSNSKEIEVGYVGQHLPL